MITFHITLLWVLASFELLLALYILIRYQRTPSIWALAGTITGFVIMAASVAAQLTVADNTTRLFFGNAAYFGGMISFVMLLALAIYYPIPSRVRFVSVFLTAPVAFFTPFIFFNPHFVDSITRTGANLHIEPGNGFWFFAVFAVVYFDWTIALLIRKIPRVVGVQRTQLQWVTLLTAITGSGGIVLTFFLPMLGRASNPVVGGEIHGALALLIAFIVLKK